MKSALALTITLFLFCTPMAFGGTPSWFPNVSCKQAWSGKDKARFNFAKDADYVTYKQRLKAESVISREACYKDWTVLVYMAADNDLSKYALWDLSDMEGSFESGNYAASTLKSDLVVEADLKGRSGIARLHMFQNPGAFEPAKSADRFEDKTLSLIRSPVVSLLPETTSRGSADHEAALASFLDWGIKSFPAKNYAVVIWGHGEGWSSAGDRKFGGLFRSEDTQSSFSVSSLARALKTTRVFSLENSKPIDLLVTDACLMQTVEIATELSTSARFSTGSSQVQSFLGLPYRQFMYELNTGRFGSAKNLVGGGDEAFLLARLLPDLARNSFDPLRGQQGRADKEASKSLTSSSVSSDSLRARLLPALDLVGAHLTGFLTEDPMRSGDLRSLIKRTPNFMGGTRDLGSFLSILRSFLVSEPSLLSNSKTARALLIATEAAEVALRETVVSADYGSRYSTAAEPFHLAGFSAFGVWLPLTPAEFNERRADFDQSLFSRGAPHWQLWLGQIF